MYITVQQGKPLMENKSTTPEVMLRWESIAEDIRQRMLASTWCENCRTLTSIKIESMVMKGDNILLEGLCPICGKAVARIVEPKQKKGKHSPPFGRPKASP